jgi:GNAT superfamily N-acetyltransferase
MSVADMIHGLVDTDVDPRVSGLQFRHFRGCSDFPQMVSLINACKTIDQIERTDSVENLAHTYAHLLNCDPRRDMVMAEAHDQLVGYCRLWWYDEQGSGRLFQTVGYVRPDWRRRGVGRAMLAWCEQRAALVDAGLPAAPSRWLGAWLADSIPSAHTLFASAGYSAARHYFAMVRPPLDDLPDARLPPGLELRPAAPEHYRPIWSAHAEAFQDHWGVASDLEDSYQFFIEEPHFLPHLWRVAWDGDQVAGQVRSFINPEENREYGRLRGYTENISVRRPWRRRGLASALIALSLQALKDEGMREAALAVDAASPSGAVSLYERCGFQVARRSTHYRKALVC